MAQRGIHLDDRAIPFHRARALQTDNAVHSWSQDGVFQIE